MIFLTDFADQAVILPVVVAISITLLAQRWPRGAAAWVLAIVVTFAAMLVLKLVFLACSTNLGTDAIRTPSGHVAAATVIAGGLAGLLLQGRAIAMLLAALAALIIGISRLVLGMHSPAEVIIGACVGLAGACLLLKLAGPRPTRLDARRVAVIAAIVALIFHGLHLPAEAHIRLAAWRVTQFLGVCQADMQF